MKNKKSLSLLFICTVASCSKVYLKARNVTKPVTLSSHKSLNPCRNGKKTFYTEDKASSHNILMLIPIKSKSKRRETDIAIMKTDPLDRFPVQVNEINFGGYSSGIISSHYIYTKAWAGMELETCRQKNEAKP